MYRAVIVIAAVALVVGCQPQKSPAEQMAEKNKELARQAYDAFSADDWNKVTTLIAEDFVDHNPEPGQKPGLEGAKEIFKKFRSTFPDMKMTIHHMAAEGEWVATHLSFSGTHQGELSGIPATGKMVTVEGFDLFRFANGKIVERWGVFDNLGMMMQLGMIPPPGQPQAQQPKEMKKK